MATTLGNVNLFVRDIEQAKRFYVEGVGLVEDVERSHPPSFALLRAGACTLTLQDASAPGAQFEPSRSVELGFAVDDIEATRERLAARGATVSDVEQMGWGGGFDALDPDGHRLTIYRMRG
ncbi:MAG TPA: VOC family protein [Kouleothrix sp.]|uniref:VOC family protein n=1 Tax=Kouleothrix sp. TaxID=2779161 RepID=UPI002C0D5040|nr:VOC family protein [Kouleothrix sp.]